LAASLWIIQQIRIGIVPRIQVILSAIVIDGQTVARRLAELLFHNRKQEVIV